MRCALVALLFLTACSERPRVHPDALPNTHAPGKVNRKDMVAFIVDDPDTLGGVVVDEAEAELVGAWRYSTHTPPHVGVGYLHDEKRGKGTKSVTYRTTLPAAGLYEVRVSHCSNDRRATNTQVTIGGHAGGESTVRINQQREGAHGRLFETVGRYRFGRGARAWDRISNEGTKGKYVIADAVQWLRVGD